MVACTPHPGLGTVVYGRVQVDLATCARTAVRTVPQPAGPHIVGRTIVFHGRVVVTARKGDAAEPAGASPDGRWVLYAIDPLSSASLAADGLLLRAVGAGGGRSYPIATALMYASYRAWCGGRLVVTAGPGRETTTGKWLVTAAPPSWRTRILARSPQRAFGSLACDGGGVVVQSTEASPRGFHAPHWALWRAGWNGALTRLTSPPAGVSDESPQVAGGVVYFVRSGSLYALRAGRLLGPLLRLPAAPPAFFGHRDWPYTVTR